MKKLLVALVLLAGCGQKEPDPMCDYCHKPRADAKIYSCRQCGQTHRSCQMESPLHAFGYTKGKKEEGGALSTSVKNCP